MFAPASTMNRGAGGRIASYSPRTSSSFRTLASDVRARSWTGDAIPGTATVTIVPAGRKRASRSFPKSRSPRHHPKRAMSASAVRPSTRGDGGACVGVLIETVDAGCAPLAHDAFEELAVRVRIDRFATVMQMICDRREFQVATSDAGILKSSRKLDVLVPPPLDVLVEPVHATYVRQPVRHVRAARASDRTGRPGK